MRSCFDLRNKSSEVYCHDSIKKTKNALNATVFHRVVCQVYAKPKTLYGIISTDKKVVRE